MDKYLHMSTKAKMMAKIHFLVKEYWKKSNEDTSLVRILLLKYCVNTSKCFQKKKVWEKIV